MDAVIPLPSCLMHRGAESGADGNKKQKNAAYTHTSKTCRKDCDSKKCIQLRNPWHIHLLSLHWLQSGQFFTSQDIHEFHISKLTNLYAYLHINILMFVQISHLGGHDLFLLSVMSCTLPQTVGTGTEKNHTAIRLKLLP